MRKWLIAVLTFVASLQFAHAAAEHCRFLQSGAHYIEWSEDGEPRGARVVSRDPRWELRELGWHVDITASCPTCSDHQISSAAIWLEAGGPSQRDLDQWIAPDSVAFRMRLFPFRVYDAKFRAKSVPVQVSFGGLEGRARILSADSSDGHVHELIAIAVERECLALLGFLFDKDGAPTSIDELASFAGSIAVERYTPDPAKYPPPPPQPHFDPEEFQIGGFKRFLEGQQR